MKLCFIILAHDKMDRLVRLINLILKQECAVCLHLDKKVPEKDVTSLQDKIDVSNSPFLLVDRVKCAWGTFSLVEAVLNAVKKIDESGYSPDYVYLISGADIPVKPISSLKEFLKHNHGREYIESFNINDQQWIKDGLTTERYERYFVFNFQNHRWLFDFSIKVQRLLGIKRKFPESYKPHFGSQWWCLTWKSIMAIHAISKQSKIRLFFKAVWIPDELFFQSMIRKVAEENDIVNYSLTFYRFNHQGKPILIYKDRLKALRQMPYFFARKLGQYETGVYSDLMNIQNEEMTLNGDTLKQLGENVSLYDSYVQKNKVGHSAIHRKITKLSNLAGLQVNNRPYFILLGAFEDELGKLSDLLNDFDGIVCHRRLFNIQEIQFKGGDDSDILYRKDDIPLRDYCPPIFLCDLINSEPKSIVGFLCMREDFRRVISGFENWLSSAIQWDQNCKVVIIKNDTRSFLGRDNSDNRVLEIFHGYIKEASFLNKIASLKSGDQKNLFIINNLYDTINSSSSYEDVIRFIKGSGSANRLLP